jgi:hypothetical protein
VLLAIVVALADPLSTSVAPLPPPLGLTVPEIVKVGVAGVVSVKFTPTTSAPLTVVLRLAGLNVMLARLGTTVYVPFGNPANL